MGDQIYADLNTVPYPSLPKRDQNLNFYLSKYREAFSYHGIQDVMARVPTYMIMDDHDIVNDWPNRQALSARKAPNGSKYYVRAGGKQAYLTYQYIHGPGGLNPHSPPYRGAYGGGVYYQFMVSDYVRVFVLDLRVERDAKKQTLSNEQMAAFQSWLRRETHPEFDGISFVVSSLVFLPDISPVLVPDSWAVYGKEQTEIMEVIEEESIDLLARAPLRVVFLSGDVHVASWLSAVKQYTDKSGRRTLFKVYSVIASPLAWGGM